MRLVIGILVVFLLFIIISTVFSSVLSIIIAFFQHCLGGLSIWNSEIWHRVKIPVIIFAVVSGLTLILFASHRSDEAREREDRNFALSRGWGYAVRTDDPDGRIAGLEEKIARVYPAKEYQVSSLMTIDDRNPRISLFDCVYSTRGGRNNPHIGSACFIPSDRLGYMSSQVEVVPRTALDGALMFSQVDMGDTEFTRNYIVSSKNPDEAIKVVNGPLQAVLLEQKNVSASIVYNLEIVFGNGGFVILLYRRALQEERLALLEMARRLESAIK